MSESRERYRSGDRMATRRRRCRRGRSPRRRTVPLIGAVALVAAVSLVLSACGGGTDGEGSGTEAAGPTVSVVDDPADAQPTDPQPDGQPTPPDGASPDPQLTPPDSPPGCRVGAHQEQSCVAAGGRIDPELCECVMPTQPLAGQALDVVGVAYDDVLNFRAQPDPAAPIVATAPPATPESPSAITISATGASASHGDSTWWQVTVDGQEAWANARFLGILGASDDIMAELTAGMASLEAATAEALGEAIASTRLGSRSQDAVVVDLVGEDAISSQAWIDVMGELDDATKGERVHVTLLNIRDDTPQVIGFEITGASRTVICGRGVDYAGRCV